MGESMKKIVIGILMVAVVAGAWWVYDRYVGNLSPSEEIQRMVSAARLGDEEGFVDGFTEESGPMVGALLALSKTYSHVRVNPITRIAEAELVDEQIDGDVATVVIQHRSKTREIPMVWTANGWKIDAFEMDTNWK